MQDNVPEKALTDWRQEEGTPKRILMKQTSVVRTPPKTTLTCLNNTGKPIVAIHFGYHGCCFATRRS